jgi:type II secretion system protein N
VGIPLAGLLLVLFFMYRDFPYDRVASSLEAALSHRLDAQVVIQNLGPHMGWMGPGVEATGVRVAWRDGRTVQLSSARLRPAWSLSWLKGAPAVHAVLEGPLGQVRGTFTDDGAGAWDGDVTQLDLARLPFEPWPGVEARGQLDAQVDVRMGEAGPQGTLTFLARDGSVKLPDVPMPVPYDVCKGDLSFGDDALVHVEEVSLEGPLLDARVSGQVGSAARLDQAPLALEITLTAQPALRSVLQSAGVRVARDGTAQVRVSGTPARPVLR